MERHSPSGRVRTISSRAAREGGAELRLAVSAVTAVTAVTAMPLERVASVGRGGGGRASRQAARPACAQAARGCGPQAGHCSLPLHLFHPLIR